MHAQVRCFKNESKTGTPVRTRSALKAVEREQAFYHHPAMGFTLYTQELTTLLAQQDGDNGTTQTATTAGQRRANAAVYGEI